MIPAPDFHSSFVVSQTFYRSEHYSTNAGTGKAVRNSYE